MKEKVTAIEREEKSITMNTETQKSYYRREKTLDNL